ncbi:hypothetical protein [Microseira wollei]|uniref:Transposase n=1 Tax=Microseira wollei NIES-4236 TaxID=2530354 RepID=A0AAV3XDD0_9CYAN|nr:hypothetical protein [Microseira wollei]GET39441.1 hypothetical protein Nhal_3338 [Microseira wollei NIES-4236]
MQNSQNQVISPRTQELIKYLVLAKFSLAEIAYITGVSEQWLQNYIAAQYSFVH